MRKWFEEEIKGQPMKTGVTGKKKIEKEKLNLFQRC